MSSDSINLQTARQQFVDDLKQKGRSTATILAYNKDVDQLVEFVAPQKTTKPSQVTTQQIEDFKANLAEKNYTAKSISRKLNSIKTFCRFLIAKTFIKDNPAAPVSHPKYEIKPPRILTKMEYRSLRDVCRDDVRIYAIVEILLQTGIRIGELANLELNDVDTNQLTIRPYESHGQRQVPLNKAAQQALVLIRNIRTAIDRYFKLSDIKQAKVNDLRHTFIAHQLQAGTPLTLISQLVGHKRLSTTEKYLEVVNRKDSTPTSLEEL